METDNVLREAKRLYDQGFAIHWLRPKSKVPLEPGWTTGPRKPWIYLRETYKPGFNVGVRLGKASALKGGFLGVVDVDVKSLEGRHAKEAARKLDDLGLRNLPTVNSGRGNGSRHYYIVTPKPVSPTKVYQSTEMVKVAMPSTRPSKRELSTLTREELESGLRLRNAWEIALMGEGQQVVLPTSVHPDTGRHYTWARDFDAGIAAGFNGALKKMTDAGNVDKSVDNQISQQNVGKSVVSKTTPGKREPNTVDFQVEHVDMAWLPINEKIRKMIMTGEGAPDRSAALLPVTQALLKAGLTQNEILSVLTDENNYLGSCAYEHAKTNDRRRAAAWVWRYTLKNVIAKHSAKALFAAPIEEAKPLTATERLEDEEAFDDTEDSPGAFYFWGDKGARVPDYNGILEHFRNEYPYKTIADMRSVYVFDKTHYRHFSPLEIKGFSEDKFDPKPNEKIRQEFLNKVLANNVDLRSFFVTTTENKINFNNGILELDDVNFYGPRLSDHTPDVGFRGVLPYDYDPEATCPFFEKWLDGIMLGDKELIAVVQEFMGYIVRGGEYKYHKALWLGGVGRNGKSTFIDLLKALIGSGNFSTISIKSLISDKFAGADLDGKIANFSEETSPQELADSGPFKNLTGDGEIYAQKKYGDPYSFRNRAKLIMTYNTIPDLKDLSAGMLSRPLIIPFRKIIKDDDQDRGIKGKLFEELSGIFNFALRGWERLEEQNGFTRAKASDEALTRVSQESCNVYQWVENQVTMTNDGPDINPVKPRDIYDAYVRKERFPYKAIEFFRRLNRHPEIAKRRARNSRERFYFGLDF